MFLSLRIRCSYTGQTVATVLQTKLFLPNVCATIETSFQLCRITVCARYVLQFGSCQLHTTVTIYIQNIGEREKRIFFPYFFSSVSLKSFFLFRTHSMESALACKSQQENKRVEKSGIQHRKKKKKTTRITKTRYRINKTKPHSTLVNAHSQRSCAEQQLLHGTVNTYS